MEIVTACLVAEQSLRKGLTWRTSAFISALAAFPFPLLFFHKQKRLLRLATPFPPTHTQTIITTSTTLKMPLYDYRVAKTALSEGEKDRILAVYLNTTADAVTCSFPPASPQAVLTHI